MSNTSEKTLICIGGGELKAKETLKIDGYIAEKAKKRAGERRAYGLFIPTASHDSMPYFNSFRKTYTSVFDIKADVALTVYGEMSMPKLEEKAAADTPPGLPKKNGINRYFSCFSGRSHAVH